LCLLLVVAGLLCAPGVAHAQAGASAPAGDAQNAGRALRQKMLTMTPSEMGVAPTTKSPRVYGVLMDVPIGNGHAATVFANSLGDASLYTTGTFSIVGSGEHEAVRKAVLAFVEAAGGFYERATPVTTFPYPAPGKVRFYLLTFNGVRMLEADLESLRRGASKSLELFNLGNAVITELRIATEPPPKAAE
jgi:hypothetical protein